MKAEAWGAQRHEKDHILAEGVDFRLTDLAADGSVVRLDHRIFPCFGSIGGI